MKRKILLVALLIFALNMSFVALSMSGQQTYGNYYTWDADMINADDVHAQYTGAGVYVAVLDTGLAPNWKDYFPEERIAAHLGKGFKEEVHFNPKTREYVYGGVVRETSFIGSTGTEHGTHVTSTIIGYNYYYNGDQSTAYRLYGAYLPPIYVEGIAPDVTIIPVKVLSDYHFGTKYLPPEDEPHAVFGTEKAVAAGIDYATDLAIQGYMPMIITMSLGGSELTQVEQDAIDRAIANGVIVVAAAGNAGTEGMHYPGAYPPVISVGACGWKYEWYWPNGLPDSETGFIRNRLWWLQYGTAYRDIADPTVADEVYIADFSSRELAGQDLDVVAPGTWVRGPYAGDPGYSHLPWWSNGLGANRGRNPGNFYYVGGTSMATPHVTSVVAMMLQKNPTLTQAQVEVILENTALEIPAGSMQIWDFVGTSMGWVTYPWGDDSTGSGLVQADAAIADTPP